jgi:hypothetical protein
VRVWFGAKELEVCEIDLRVGGRYHFVGLVMDGDTAGTAITSGHRQRVTAQVRSQRARGGQPGGRRIARRWPSWHGSFRRGLGLSERG